MEITIHKKRSVKEAGDLIATVDNKLYALIEDEDDKYPYLLLNLQTFKIIQNYDSLPTNQELEFDIEAELSGVYHHEDAEININ
ncbi:hypothetical protein [Alkalihalobacillus sp. 1P02AB]|uniref:hypothetical protein n=1 Tax=Alkalihalobacillus sp. 1P02AB TaxID=3132260 RepID=UPI0039A5C90C